MDYESFFKGYATGVALHNHLRDGTPIDAPPIASFSVTGIAADLEWFADLSGVRLLPVFRAEYSGPVTVCYGYDGEDYTDYITMEELAAQSAEMASGVDPRNPALYFRFHLDDGAELNAFRLYGVPKGAN